MPTWHEAVYDQRKLTALRKAITQKLIAKGLMEGCGKWATVFARHFNKQKNTCLA
jgi:hypothetical protein